jgi:hypothetical protein
MRTADVARAIHCNVRTVRHLRQCYRETGWTADRPGSGRPHVRTPASHLRGRYRMATTTSRVTSGTHNPSISAHTVRNRLREAGLRVCRPVVRQDLTRHHRQQRRLWAQTHCCWTRQDWQKSALHWRVTVLSHQGWWSDSRLSSKEWALHRGLYSGADRFGGGGSIMVWGGVSQHHRTELVLLMFIQIFTDVKFAENKLCWQWEDVYFFASRQ